jgi:hypothetical protein
MRASFGASFNAFWKSSSALLAHASVLQGASDSAVG